MGIGELVKCFVGEDGIENACVCYWCLFVLLQGLGFYIIIIMG